MNLKFEEKIYKVVDYYHLDQFIKSIFPKSTWEFASEAESANDTDHTVNVKKFTETYELEWDLPAYEQWKKDPTKSLGYYKMMCGLCTDGHIPEGTYLVRVSW